MHVLAKHHLAVIADVLVQRYLIRSRSPAPPALPVTYLIDDDSEDPGAKRRLAAEPVQGSEDPQKHFLRQIEGLFTIAEQVGGEAQHQPMMFEDQGCVRLLVARQTSLDQDSFAAGNVRPGDGFGR